MFKSPAVVKRSHENGVEARSSTAPYRNYSDSRSKSCCAAGTVAGKGRSGASEEVKKCRKPGEKQSLFANSPFLVRE
jgi:hypothetical protein